ncbi:hypothetical protein AOLI_G00231930 [Acnodon oligacanthus]
MSKYPVYPNQEWTQAQERGGRGDKHTLPEQDIFSRIKTKNVRKYSAGREVVSKRIKRSAVLERHTKV